MQFVILFLLEPWLCLDGRAVASHRYFKFGFSNYGYLYLAPMVITMLAVLWIVQLFGLNNCITLNTLVNGSHIYIGIHFCRIMETILLSIKVKLVASAGRVYIKTVTNNFSPVKNSQGRRTYKSVILNNNYNNLKWCPCYDGNYYKF